MFFRYLKFKHNFFSNLIENIKIYIYYYFYFDGMKYVATSKIILLSDIKLTFIQGLRLRNYANRIRIKEVFEFIHYNK